MLIIKIFILGNGDWGLGIGDWGLGPIPKSPIPIPNPHFIIIRIINNLNYKKNY